MSAQHAARAAPRDADGDPRISLLGGNEKFVTANPQASQEIEWFRRDAIAECGEIIALAGAKIVAAALSSSPATIEVRLRQAKAALVAAIATWRELAAADAGGEQ